MTTSHFSMLGALAVIAGAAGVMIYSAALERTALGSHAEVTTTANAEPAVRLAMAATTRTDAAPVDEAAGSLHGPINLSPPVGLQISGQSFRRGGLGSRALMTLTIRNGNDYAVKDIDIVCAFRSRDGRYVTERRQTLRDDVAVKGRKTFPMVHLGYVNLKATRAKCSLLAAVPA